MDKIYKLLIQFPTRNRPEKFEKMLNLYLDLLEDKDNTLIRVSCDSSDASMKSFPYTNFNGLIQWSFADNHTKVEAINRTPDKAGGSAGVITPDGGWCFNEWEIVLVASDDMTPIVKGYDNIIRQKMFENYPDTDGVLWFYDGFRDDLNTLTIMGRKYYDRFGYIYHPDYASYYCDNELTDIAGMLNKVTRFDECIIRHDFHAHIGDPGDKLHHSNMRFFGRDGFVYGKRKSNNFIG